MKRFSLVVIVVALTMVGASGTVSAHDGGTYPVNKAMVGPGKAVIGPKDSVGIFAWKFCEKSPITITLTGPKTIVKNTKTDRHGVAAVSVSNLKVGTYRIKATACGQTAYSRLTVKVKKHAYHHIDGGSGDSVVAAFAALTSGMDARSQAVSGLTDRAAIPTPSAASDTEGVRLMQLGVVAALCAIGLGGVTAVRHRSNAVQRV